MPEQMNALAPKHVKVESQLQKDNERHHPKGQGKIKLILYATVLPANGFARMTSTPFLPSDHLDLSLIGIPSPSSLPAKQDDALLKSPHYTEIMQNLHNIFGLKSFHDSMVLMPTGGLVCKDSKTWSTMVVVIGSLLALMQDQVAVLQDKGIDVAFFNLEQTHEEVDVCRRLLHRIRRQWPNLIHMMPEKLKHSSALISSTISAKFLQSMKCLNLNYEAWPKKKVALQEIVQFIKESYTGETGIIYVHSRKLCKEIMYRLKEEHDLDAQLQFAIHHDLPSDLDCYYQDLETGHTGRGGQPAHCILSQEDALHAVVYQYSDSTIRQWRIHNSKEIMRLRGPTKPVS
ncbi:uncharacterized protein LAESUDRAFT_713541 [Laetiporus sulphureus 93-53]|uniref:DNA 3'-5' helicase n=1 Tax=Laetiporus sulphureus 93-53 TaxID=1314785 RepID=A0A165ENH5_9APHY|nr:uncharacterized protein LAESUDRAFT_713541 [Laetiporus sulphureus 93-53]KZT07432.1 hypothetical protein LAESUDRAFT_713541 [Laetiporus sulphureus 93-53]